MNNTILEIQNISKSFKGQIVLQDISFSLHQGTIVGLLGANGAGQSTLEKTGNLRINYNTKTATSLLMNFILIVTTTL